MVVAKERKEKNNAWSIQMADTIHDTDDNERQ
jgi:hypothetical protein